MRLKIIIVATVCVALALAATSARDAGVILPSGWMLRPPSGPMTLTDTLPQGAAASPDGTALAVVESGYNPATLRIYGTNDLEQRAVFPLKGAFGRPLWLDATHILVAGANADAIFEIDTSANRVRTIAMPAHTYPVALALSPDKSQIAVATDADRSVRIGALDDLAGAKPVRLGNHPGGLAFNATGTTLFAAVRGDDRVFSVEVHSLRTRVFRVGLHPTDLLVVNRELFVAESDDDSVGVYDTATGVRTSSIFVGDTIGNAHLEGSSPNALARAGDTLFVSLGGANSIAVLRGRRIVGHIATGWYPTDVVPVGDRLFAIDGKGEGMRPNPHYRTYPRSAYDYIGTIQFGSIRAYTRSDIASSGSPQGAGGWRLRPDSVLRKGGPIQHVFLVLKENRTYDQVLGDLPQANGDRKLVWFGSDVTPNQHALARRFGIFDNTYTNGEVSDSGHNWTDAAFANDYVERFWAPTYGGRRDEDDLVTGRGAATPRNGYIWDAAARAHVSFRDYGELAEATAWAHASGNPIAPTLRGRFDTRYRSWDLSYSDLDRVKEWRREFRSLLRADALPQFEFVWLPNDHTSGAKPGAWTPRAYVAQNDYAVGQLIDTISHSPVWKSSAIFIIEDDSQDGADHVSAQRTTAYVVSPYARGGVNHTHYATVSMLRTIEVMLGIGPLSAYDAMAAPMYDAFTPVAHMQPFVAISPRISISERNAKTAYGAAISATVDFSRPDAAPAGVMLDIIAHNR